MSHFHFYGLLVIAFAGLQFNTGAAADANAPFHTLSYTSGRVKEKAIKHNGAGILPYIVDSSGEIWVLLGREAKNGEWCDFGGAKEPKETSFDTAIREAWEETRAVIGGPSSLRERISKAFSLKTISKEKKYYITYFLRLDFITENQKQALVETFNKTKAWKKQAAEKDQICWIRLDSLLAALADQTLSMEEKNLRMRSYFCKTLQINKDAIVKWMMQEANTKSE